MSWGLGGVDIGSFLNHKRPKKLISIALNIERKTENRVRFMMRTQRLMDFHWNPWIKMMEYIEKIAGNDTENVFDGYLEIEMPSKSWPAGRIVTDWNVNENINYSLEIAQSISRIHTKMRQSKEGNKMILNLKNFDLHQKHIQFLKFWFDDNESFAVNSWRESVYILLDSVN